MICSFTLSTNNSSTHKHKHKQIHIFFHCSIILIFIYSFFICLFVWNYRNFFFFFSSSSHIDVIFLFFFGCFLCFFFRSFFVFLIILPIFFSWAIVDFYISKHAIFFPVLFDLLILNCGMEFFFFVSFALSLYLSGSRFILIDECFVILNIFEKWK